MVYSSPPGVNHFDGEAAISQSISVVNITLPTFPAAKGLASIGGSGLPRIPPRVVYLADFETSVVGFVIGISLASGAGWGYGNSFECDCLHIHISVKGSMFIRVNLVTPSVRLQARIMALAFYSPRLVTGVRIGYRDKQSSHVSHSSVPLLWFGFGFLASGSRWLSAQPSIRRCRYSLLHFTAEVRVLFPAALLRFPCLGVSSR